jgi:serine phosphatase RsbU (regulator of sigma subunit)
LVRCLGKTLDDPARLLAVVNREVCEAATGGRFVTLAVGIYDPGQDRVRLASAGHLPALHLVGGEAVRAIPAQGPPLGVIPEARFASDSLSLAGGSLYLFSDGLLEARVGEAALGFAGIEGLLRETAHLPAAERLARVVARVQNAGGPTRDDVTLLVVGR